ncbi:TPA: hypothetical protein WI164_002100 [Neisseria meningitidis]|uniref:hypothetical protein n=1 Tax=Neisseria meningitidis TaxID=487 RepID=UPI000F538619|nr:hypothetical protein [Neisseria meningitidis]MCL5714946.1 hypothetical protein [Neisseria meningitidis]RQK67717.1 hypothetical protein COH59_01205 [Neisseria meningitidis]
MEVTRNLKQAKPNELDSRLRGNDEVEVTRNLKQAKPNELDSRLRGNDEFQVAVFGFLFL